MRDHCDNKKNNRIIFENTFAEEMLAEAAKNEYIKIRLQELANVLKQLVLAPLIKAADQSNSFQELEQNYKKQAFGDAIIKLATNQSNERMQYGASMRAAFVSHKEIISDIKNVRTLLTTLNNAISTILKIETIEGIAVVLKAFVDLGVAYIDWMKLPEKNSDKYNIIKNEVFSSSRELSARITRKEMGLPDVLSMRCGIGQTSNDLIFKSTVKDFIQVTEPGKSIFFGVSTEQRLKLMRTAYQKHYGAWLLSKSENDLKKIEEIKKNCLKEYGEKAAEMLFSGDKESEIDFKSLAKKLFSQYEKFSIMTDLPMLATTSGSTARPIIALLMKDAFYTENKIDLDKLQVLSNCLAGFMVHAGHHSISEVAEIYNKAIDYMLIHDSQNIPDTMIEIMIKVEEKEKSGELTSDKALAWFTKEIGYYYVYGNYETFLNSNYRKKVMETVNNRISHISSIHTNNMII
jgi:hypothetical protein